MQHLHRDILRPVDGAQTTFEFFERHTLAVELVYCPAVDTTSFEITVRASLESNRAYLVVR